MGKRPVIHKQGKVKGKKRTRVQRDYDDGLEDEIEQQEIPKGPRAARSTQKKVEVSIMTWERVREAQFHQSQDRRFAKPKPAEKVKGLTKAQRRAQRRRELRGPVVERAWPTRKQLRSAARAHVAGRDHDDEEPSDEEVEAASSSDEEEEEEAEEEEGESEEEEEAPAAEEEEEEDVDGADDDADAVGRARARAAEAHFGLPLHAAEVGALSARCPAGEYVATEHAAVSGGALDWTRLEREEQRLGVRFAEANEIGASRAQRVLLRACASFKDVVQTDVDFEARPALLRAALAHALDHVARSRRAMLRHTGALRRAEADVTPAPPRKGASRSAPLVPPKPTEKYQHLDEAQEDTSKRDQGPTRCRALVLVATRKAALEVCLELRALCGGAAKHADRLESELGVDDDDPAMQREGPPDWEAVFGGNCDDACEVGISVRVDKGQSVAVEFFAGTKTKADIIVATPLALRLAAEEEDRKGVLDRLAAVEVVVVDQADVLLYQNWETVERALKACDGAPSRVVSDVGRVRLPFLDAHGAACRQHVVLASFNDARFRALLDRPLDGQLRNRSGCVRLAGPPQAKGSLARAVSSNVAHAFRGVRCAAPASAPDARVSEFRDRVLPGLLRRSGATIAGARTLVYCGSYPEFLACRAALREKGANFVAIHEYSRNSEVSRGRSKFFHGRVPLLLYSGRAHFYQRYRIRGASNYVFVSPPDHAHFYSELLSFAREDEFTGAAPTSLCLYTRFDALALSRVLGDPRARACLKRDARGVGGDHMFHGPKEGA